MADLNTKFIFDDSDAAKVDALYDKLTRINTSLTGLGQSSNFGNTIAGQINLTNKELAENISLQTKLAQQEKATELAAKAAIQTERERLKLEQDLLKVKTQSQGINTNSPAVSGGGDYFQFSDKRKATLEAEHQAANLVRQEESKKAFDALNNDEELYLQTSIARKKTLAEEERKLADYKIYQADRAAKAQIADAEAVPDVSADPAAPGKGTRLGRVRGFGAIFRAVGSPVNESELNAVSAVAEHLGVTLEGVEAAIAGISSGFLLTAGAVAAAGLIAIQYSRSVREEAERRLKVEEDLAIAYGKQQVAIKAGLNDLMEARRLAEQDRAFNRQLQQGNINDLTVDRDVLLGIQGRSSPNRIKRDENGQIVLDKDRQVVYEQDPDFARRSQQILNIDNQLATLKDNQQKARQESYRNLQDSYNNGVDDKRKSAEEAARDAAKDAEDLKKSIEEGTKKVQELSDQYTKTIDNLFLKTGSSNPFVKIFDEGNKALDELRKNLRGLTPELQSQLENLQRTLNDNQRFSTKLDNSLSVLDLKDKAEDFRNPKITQAQINTAAANYINGSNSTADIYRRNYGQNLADEVGGINKLTDDQKRNIYEVSLFRNLQNVNPGNPIFDQLNQDSLTTRLARERLGSDGNLTIQQRLQKRFDKINSDNPLNAEQRDTNDRQIIALSQNIDPSKLNDQQRNYIADAFDRRAAKTENYQKDANELLKEQNRLQAEQVKQTAAWLKIAQTEGIKAVLEIIDKTNGSVNVREGTQPNRKDTEKTYNQD